MNVNGISTLNNFSFYVDPSIRFCIFLHHKNYWERAGEVAHSIIVYSLEFIFAHFSSKAFDLTKNKKKTLSNSTFLQWMLLLSAAIHSHASMRFTIFAFKTAHVCFKSCFIYRHSKYARSVSVKYVRSY